MLEKNPAEKGYPNQGWARKARTAKRVSKSRETEKWYSNCYDQSLAVRYIRGNGRYTVCIKNGTVRN